MILGATKISGPSHNNGGVDMVLNGRPVEVEGGELLLSMGDGSKIVLNESQQTQLKKGVPLSKIKKSLPHYSAMAENGTDIPPAWMDLIVPYFKEDHRQLISEANLGRDNYVELISNKSPDDATLRRERALGYRDENFKLINDPPKGGAPFSRPIQNPLKEVEIKGGKSTRPGPIRGTQVFTPVVKPGDNRISPQTSWYFEDNGLSSAGDEARAREEAEKEKDLIDQYNDNLLTSTILEGGSMLNQAMRAGLDMIKNKRKPKPAKVAPLGYSPIRPILEDPRPYIDALNMMSATKMRTAREAGLLPQEISMSSIQYPEALENIMSSVSKTNTGRILGAAEMNSKNWLAVGSKNADIAQHNVAISLEDDKMRSELDARSKDTINKALARGAGLFGEYSQNKLYSDVIREIYGKYGIDGLRNLLFPSKSTDTPTTYADFQSNGYVDNGDGTVTAPDGTILRR